MDYKGPLIKWQQEHLRGDRMSLTLYSSIALLLAALGFFSIVCGKKKEEPEPDSD